MSCCGLGSAHRGPKAAAAALNYLILATLGSSLILAGSVLALGQDELKRRLAFSTVAQVGYIALGLGLLNTNGLTGTLYHIASHAVTKSILFLAAFTVASLGLVGIPLFSGFIGKWYMLLGSLEAGELLPAAVIILRSVLCAAYLLPIIRIAFFEPAPSEDWKDPGLPQRVSLIALSIGVVALGVAPGYFFELAERAAVDLLMIG